MELRKAIQRQLQASGCKLGSLRIRMRFALQVAETTCCMFNVVPVPDSGGMTTAANKCRSQGKKDYGGDFDVLVLDVWVARLLIRDFQSKRVIEYLWCTVYMQVVRPHGISITHCIARALLQTQFLATSPDLSNMTQDLKLSQSFFSDGWTIRYGVFNAEKKHEQTVVFVHGTPWSSAVFKPLAKALLSRAGYRVVLYDLAGYGQSQDFSEESPAKDGELFEGDTSVRTQASILAALLKHIQLDQDDPRQRPALVAHDIAGAIALRASLLHGCKYRSLLLLDTNTVLPWGDGFYKLVRSEAKTFLQLPSSIFEAVVRAVIRSASHSPKEFSHVWEDILAEPWIDDDSSVAGAKQNSFVRQIAQANDADVAEMLDHNLYENMQCPVKTMWGEQDQWIPREKLESLADMLKDSFKEFVVVPDAGHLVMIDQPERVAIETFDWLTKN
ncbi:alpha/beta-hydrolase [Karstenula rhodostoma CBS 690.94]|uniref:Alpha/beta-hydrolase n=1 Tax=Karstenula rhodostoma CBS 690.94 TaxID=1392251 RepID=A0A9P4PL51_9PLEO|nr:alpha/beta-hydrolase [Karstenula rhodostoma CBS 690.94]